ncbi:putative ribosome biosynthesis protein [Martiniozyma asiatica (nom. inval.)]|nr:putative ribosome biosynthesis protein [Martiniozyma asiatica]
MRLSKILPTILALCVVNVAANAIYPPVKADNSLKASDDDEIVTIQGNEKLDKSNIDAVANSMAKSIDSGSSLSETDEEFIESAADASKFKAFYMALSMIFVSEIGDKTFLLAALMAMRNSRTVVFSAAGSALVLMTILSGLLGYILPNLLSPTVTRYLAAGLFFVFGINLLREGLAMDKNQGVEEELAEVEEEVAAAEISKTADTLENGSTESKQLTTLEYVISQFKSTADYILSPIWVQTFVMTFLGEWGDRSQIATIAMAAGSDYTMVILGGSIGHLICTFGACLGGQMLAKKISMRTVVLGGSGAFLVFAVLYLYSALYE